MGSFRDVEILKAGAWTQGPVLLQTMGILDGFGDAELDLNASGVHLVLEALKLAFADRERVLRRSAIPRRARRARCRRTMRRRDASKSMKQHP